MSLTVCCRTRCRHPASRLSSPPTSWSRNGYAKLRTSVWRNLWSPVTRHARSRRDQPGAVSWWGPWHTCARTSHGSIAGRPERHFSFGVVLYELLPVAGLLAAPRIDVLHAIIHQTVWPLGADVPSELRAVVEKALSKDPAERYQSMRELVVDLRRVSRAAETPVTAKRWWMGRWPPLCSRGPDCRMEVWLAPRRHRSDPLRFCPQESFRRSAKNTRRDDRRTDFSLGRFRPWE